MPHPIMFDDDDPVLGRVRDIARAFPEATEVVAHGRPTFRCGRVFCHYGGSIRGGERREQSILVLPDPAEADALRSDPRVFVPAYLGPSGWLGLDLSGRGDVSGDAPDWDEVGELIDASYRRIAPARLVRLLDQR
ncbi:MmcQ/YjbR family DNA-binding protein [Williamsia sp. MIQD14]|uniref:MmcQ/YjbR family DNA-binding protein n=1 Tax=Williamsia sp. MIQD14 TaxID=3425703 RepID=UPI003DA0E82A